MKPKLRKYVVNHPIDIQSAIYALFDGGYPCLVKLIRETYPDATGNETIAVIGAVLRELAFPYQLDTERLNHIIQRDYNKSLEYEEAKKKLKELGYELPV